LTQCEGIETITYRFLCSGQNDRIFRGVTKMSRRIKTRARALITEQCGVTATEYAIVAAVIAVVLVAAVGFVGSELTRSYMGLANTMAGG
jgi:Flp pilus assembly pilin Flp